MFERLQVLRGIGDRQLHFHRQGLDGAFALGQELEDLETVRIGHSFPEPRELPV
jgi:hypothetical protein